MAFLFLSQSICFPFFFQQIASLAASYLTRQLFAILEDSLEPLLVDQIFKALQVGHVDEDSTGTCLFDSFINKLQAP